MRVLTEQIHCRIILSCIRCSKTRLLKGRMFSIRLFCNMGKDIEIMKFFLKRVLQAIPVLLVVSIFAFYLVNVAPGDPALSYRTPDMSDEAYQAIRDSFGLNDPIYVQYLDWAKNILKGNWGTSISTRQPVTRMIMQKLPATVGLMLASIIFSVLVAIILGLIAGYRQNTWIDRMINGITYIGMSVPNFWFAILLVLLFSLTLKIFPSNGMHTQGVGSIPDVLWHGVLPMLAVSVSKIAVYTKYIRASVIKQLSEDYVVTAVAKGADEKRILLKHILKNCLLPIITIVGMNMGSLVTGSFVIESVFGWPGLGTLCFSAIINRDYPLMMGTTMLSCVILIAGNLLADVLYGIVDPRIQMGGKSDAAA